MLSALALFGFWSAGVSAEIAAPPGQTIPPGGTIPPAPDSGDAQGQVNVIHVAPVDSEVIDTGVQICDEEDSTPVTGYLYYQQQTGYIDLELGTHDWYVSSADGACANVLLDLNPFLIGDGARLTLLIFGDNANQDLDSMVIVEEVGDFIYHWPIIFK
jgi:hypothetical protein